MNSGLFDTVYLVAEVKKWELKSQAHAVEVPISLVEDRETQRQVNKIGDKRLAWLVLEENSSSFGRLCRKVPHFISRGRPEIGGKFCPVTLAAVTACACNFGGFHWVGPHLSVNASALVGSITSLLGAGYAFGTETALQQNFTEALSKLNTDPKYARSMLAKFRNRL